MDGTKPNKPLYIVLAILIACALWLYVRSVDTQDRTLTISRIPVTFVGEDVLNNNGFMLSGDQSQTVNLTVQGRWGIISQLRRDNIAIQVDLSSITAEGEYSRAYDIAWPGNISASSFALVNREPFYVPVTVVKRVSKEVEVRGVFLGSVADGYQSGAFTFQPDRVTISGPEDAVDPIAYAQVTLNRDGLTDTVREDAPYVLVNYDGETVTDPALKSEPAQVGVTMPVTHAREIPLTVDFLPGGGISGGEDDHLTWTIEPSSVTIAGTESDLDAYGDAISVATIDLAKTSLPFETEFTIPLGEEVENLTGTTKAQVKLSASGLEVREFTTGNIELVNSPADIDVSVVTQSVTVQVRGTAEALDQIMPQQNLQVRVDLADLSAIPDGQSPVPAAVSVLGVDGAGVIGDGYTVTIIASGAGQIGGGT